MRLGPSTRTSSTAPTRARVSLGGDALDDLDELLDPLALDLLRNLVGHRGCLGAGARRVDERERAVEADLLDDFERLGEVGVCLAGEADDDVGRQREVGDRCAQLADEREIAVARVRAPHRLEDARRAGLERQVRVLADSGAVRPSRRSRLAGSPSGAGS